MPEPRIEEVIRVGEHYYILATSSLVRERTHVLKDGDSFAIFDCQGDIGVAGPGVQGIYHEETRFLSRLVLTLAAHHPLLLSSSVREDNLALRADLTNPDLHVNGRVVLPRGALHISRQQFLWRGTCYQELRFTNYSLAPVELSFALEFDSDFVDVFEVRGLRRSRRGRRLPEEVGEDWVVLGYEGLDGQIRRTRLRVEPQPAPGQLTPGRLEMDLRLAPHAETAVLVTIACETGEPGPVIALAAAASQARQAQQTRRDRACRIYTANEVLNDWVGRSLSDLQMMLTETPHGPYPYAGVPWFSTVFGRDGLVTALETLWVDPEIARGVLRFLAATQAREHDPDVEAEPGKILHEMRKGEMAALGEVPFGRYYGSVDATPLFVAVAGACYRRTGDRGLLEELWPHIEAALEWMERYGDRDGDGFIEYARRSSRGLVHQGWKDSPDAIFHADGTLAEGPIAVCEVQGYAFLAYRRAAEMAAALGLADAAERYAARAEALRARFEKAFWSEELSSYALALDGQKRPCLVRSSNPGQCLWTGIVSAERAARLARTLLAPEQFSGWGIRTLAATEVRYNPMAYHNGSVWPHDNALIAHGMARYGLTEGVNRIFTGLFDASLFLELHRMPELFCGFPRRPGEGPTLYPVACAPQAWAAGAVFLLLEACLGLRIRAAGRPVPQIRFERPFLPASIPEMRMENLRVGEASVDLSVVRVGDDVSVNILDRQGQVEVVVVK
jgi:glycogen debranching enzyme